MKFNLGSFSPDKFLKSATEELTDKKELNYGGHEKIIKSPDQLFRENQIGVSRQLIEDIRHQSNNTLELFKKLNKPEADTIRELTESVQELVSVADKVLDPKSQGNDSQEFIVLSKKVDKTLDKYKDVAVAGKTVISYLRDREVSEKLRVLGEKSLQDRMEATSGRIRVPFGQFLKDNYREIKESDTSKDALQTATAIISGPFAPLVLAAKELYDPGKEGRMFGSIKTLLGIKSEQEKAADKDEQKQEVATNNFRTTLFESLEELKKLLGGGFKDLLKEEKKDKPGVFERIFSKVGELFSGLSKIPSLFSGGLGKLGKLGGIGGLLGLGGLGLGLGDSLLSSNLKKWLMEKLGLEGPKKDFEKLKNWGSREMEVLSDAWRQTKEGAINLGSKASDLASEGINKLGEGALIIMNKLQALPDQIRAFQSELAKSISSSMTTAGTIIAEKFGSAADYVRDKFKSATDRLMELPGLLHDGFVEVFKFIKDMPSKMLGIIPSKDEVIDKGKAALSSINGYISSAKEWALGDKSKPTQSQVVATKPEAVKSVQAVPEVASKAPANPQQVQPPIDYEKLGAVMARVFRDAMKEVEKNRQPVVNHERPRKVDQLPSGVGDLGLSLQNLGGY